VVVFPADNVSWVNVEFTDVDFYEKFKNEFHVEETIGLQFELKDKYGNVHCDRISEGK
jgi:hypothetical protein